MSFENRVRIRVDHSIAVGRDDAQAQQNAMREAYREAIKAGFSEMPPIFSDVNDLAAAWSLGVADREKTQDLDAHWQLGLSSVMAKDLRWAAAAELAKNGGLNSDFDRWWLSDDSGRTVAHLAAEHGPLPKDFDQWELADDNGYTVAHVAAKYGHLPKDFDRWGLADESGETVAHVAAYHGHLPTDFDQWSLADEGGEIVANVAAWCGHLPKDFDQWDLHSRFEDRVETVAHAAARAGFLPEGFNNWQLTGYSLGYGVNETVAHAAAEYGHLPKDFDQWHLADNEGRTVAHIAAERDSAAELSDLPKDFNQWHLADNEGNTVAHVAAERGGLPENFNQWSLADNDGRTVAHVAADYGRLPKDFDRWELVESLAMSATHPADWALELADGQQLHTHNISFAQQGQSYQGIVISENDNGRLLQQLPDGQVVAHRPDKLTGDVQLLNRDGPVMINYPCGEIGLVRSGNEHALDSSLNKEHQRSTMDLGM